MSEERRKQKRFDSLNISYICVDDDGDIIQEGIGRTLNVSGSGILLETSFEISPEHTLILGIAFEETLVDVHGRVAHSHEKPGGVYHTGVSFTEMGDASQEVLRNYISHFNEQDS